MSDPIPENLSLLKKVKSNKSLASKLGFSDVPPLESGKRKLMSPLKTKKFKKTHDVRSGTQISLTDSSMVHAQEETAQDEASNLPSTSGSQNPGILHPDVSEDDLNNLEEILCDDSQDSDASPHDSDSSESDEIELLGLPKDSSWNIPDKIKKFYLKASDIDLNKDVMDSIKEKYKASDDFEQHFIPPRFSSALWSSISSSQPEVFRLKSLNKIQENIFLSIKPLLDCMSEVDKSTQSKLTESIQLLCSTNLHLNIFRRTSIAPHLKPEIRKQILSLPVTHNSFFGEDFNKATDELIKEQSSLDKIINKKPVTQRLSKPTNLDQKKFFRAPRGGKNSQRGRGPYRSSSNNSRRGNSKNFHSKFQSPFYSNSAQNHQ